MTQVVTVLYFRHAKLKENKFILKEFDVSFELLLSEFKIQLCCEILSEYNIQ